MNMKIEHTKEFISFTFIDERKNLFVYYFEMENANLVIHSIDMFEKNGKTGNTYRHKEIYHKDYKPNTINFDTGEFEKPAIPVQIQKAGEIFLKGFLVNNL